MGAVTQFITAQWICKHETLLKCARFSDAVLEMWATKYSLHILCMNEVSHGVIVVKILSWGLSSFSTIQSCDVAGRVHFLAILKVSISAAIWCRPVKFAVHYHCLVHNQDMQLVLLYLT